MFDAPQTTPDYKARHPSSRSNYPLVPSSQQMRKLSGFTTPMQAPIVTMRSRVFSLRLPQVVHPARLVRLTGAAARTAGRAGIV